MKWKQQQNKSRKKWTLAGMLAARAASVWWFVAIWRVCPSEMTYAHQCNDHEDGDYLVVFGVVSNIDVSNRIEFYGF